MPALPSQQPVAVRHSTSPTRKDHYPYSSTSGMGSNTDKGGNKQGASSISTSNRNPNSMYSTMTEVWGKEHWLPNEQKIEEFPITTKAKKVTPRPSTPHGNRKNFIERNKQSVQSVQSVLASSPPKSPKKLKDDSQSVSPTPSLKQKPSTTQVRPVTPGANTQSSTRPKTDKKKSDGATSTKSRRPTSPTSTTQSAHVRSHASSPERSNSGHGHSAHSRSHVRAASPEIALREEVKKLKRIILERDDWLREKESELLEAEDIIEALQERVREVEARNRELQGENEFMRNYIGENEKKKAAPKEPTKIIDSVKNNIQRIRGELATPISKPNSPTLTSSSSASPISSPKQSPVLTTSKSKELLKANNNLTKVQNDSISPSLRPHVVPRQTRGNLIPANKVNNQKNLDNNNDPLPPRPTAPSPAAMNRHENINGGFNRTEILDRHAEMIRDRQASALDRKQAAALNVVMEESEDSDVDEFKFETDDNNSDDQADSESDDRTESESEDDDVSSVSPSGVNTEIEDYDDDDDESVDDKWSTRASSKHDLDSIVEEEDEEDDDDEFDYDETEQMARQKSRTPFNPSSPTTNAYMTFKNGHPNIGNLNNNNGNKYNHRLDSISSDSGIESAHEGIFDSNLLDSNNKDQPINNGQSVNPSLLSQQLSDKSQKQRSQQRIHQDYGYPHRDSMSSIKSDSSDDSAISVSSSQNGSYPSSVTSPSSTGSNNDLYGQSSANSSHKSNKFSSSKLDTSKFDKNGLNDNYSTADHKFINSPISSDFNNGFSDSVKNDSKSDYVSNDSASITTGSSVKRSSPNLVSKQFSPRSKSPSTASFRPVSPVSSSRASTPSSYASTARAQSPAYPSSSRASTPVSESSRNASGNRVTQPIDNSSDKCTTAIPPPPPPPVNKDPFATLQHYLRLISENSVMENPLKSYDIKKVIDEGSSAKVFTAHPLSNPSEDCAIKVVPLSYSLEFIFNEIYVLKNLKHKNIVDFKESFLRWDGKTREVWIAMEKCARGDVTSRAGKVNQREVGRIARDLLSALKHLHSNGVIHRDIKLSNILSTANNEIKLADFVDIWSVGVCILELLTGKAAWGRIRDDEIMDKLRRGEMPYGFQRLRKKADIGWEAVDFLEKCFIKTPENRWSAEKLLEHPFITGSSN